MEQVHGKVMELVEAPDTWVQHQHWMSALDKESKWFWSPDINEWYTSWKNGSGALARRGWIDPDTFVACSDDCGCEHE
jgi:hypothetical protein